MTVLIYHEGEIITPQEVAETRALDPRASHVCVSGATWPSEALSEPAWVLSPNDTSVAAQAISLVSKMQHEINPVVWRGVDVLEAAKYRWAELIQPELHRIIVLEELHRRFSPSGVHWLPVNPIESVPLQELGRQLGMEIVLHNPPWHSLVLRSARTALQRTHQAAWAAREAWRDAKAARRLGNFTVSHERPIVFAEFFPNSAKMAGKAAEMFAERTGAPTLMLAGRRDAIAPLSASGVPVAFLNQFGRKLGSTRSSAWRLIEKKFLSQLHDRCAASFRAAFPESWAHIPLGRKFAALSLRAIREAVGFVDRMVVTFETARPSCLVTTTFSSVFGRCLALVARSHSLPCLYVQHGALGEDPTLAGFLNSRILVWGERDRRELIRAGIDSTRIAVVGPPHFDNVLSQCRDAQYLLAVPPQQPPRFLLLASRAAGRIVSGAVFARTLRVVMATVLAVPEAILTVKLHPADHTGIAQRIVGDNCRVEIAQDGSSWDYIARSEIAIVTSSTTGLEACLLRKPLICFNLTCQKDYIDYAKYGAALCAYREEELNDSIRLLLTNDLERQRLRKA